MKLLGKELLAAARITGGHGSHAYVHISKNSVMATNGYIALLYEQKTELDHASFPDVGSNLVIKPPKNIALLGDDIVRDFKFQNKSSRIPQLKMAAVTKSRGKYGLATTNLSCNKVIYPRNGCDRTERPEIEKVIPKTKPKATCRLNLKLLKKLINSMIEVGCDHADFDLRGDLESVILNSENATGLIMPMKK